MEQNKNIPQIRFEGFTDDWEQRKVSELFRVTRGYVLAATQTETTKTEERPYPVYSSQTKDKGLMGYYKDYLYEDAITWTTDGANAGTVNYRAGKFYCTNVCGVLLSNEIKANQMISEALNNVAKGYVSYVGNPKLMNNVMAEIVIQIPTQAEEREQLSLFFFTIDHLITLYQQKYEKFLDLKKAMLHKLFPKEGETTPEIRFDGFSGEWKKRKIKEVCNISNGCMNTQDAKEKGKYPFFIRSEEIMKSDRYVYDEEAILTPGEGRIGEIFHYINGKYTAHQRVYRLFCFSEEVYPIFLLHELKNKFKKHALQNSSTATAPSIRMGTIADYEFMLPDFEEQKAIGEYFSKLDQLIALNKEKLEKLKNIKSLLLDKMFV